MNFKELAMQNIGAASMCWSETPSGVFETSRAEVLANEIIQAHDAEVGIMSSEIQTLKADKSELVAALEKIGAVATAMATDGLFASRELAREVLNKQRGET